ncbi:MAG TPA: metalloregulator ArsR/SmtB family transcription factor [Acidimicrobiales bacterium]|nr:metalloregulator ArsR/SmtB family transcription factor [Acidimicrobiales bacterium]
MDLVFVALADTTRRRVLELLAARDGATATQLAGSFPMTRQAIAKHLQVLAEAGLATSERRGRETQWTLTAAALGPALAWMAELHDAGGDAAFDDRLAGLQRHLGERAAERGVGIRPRPDAPAAPLHIAASRRPPRPQP